MDDEKHTHGTAAFRDAINMSPSILEQWLTTPESQKVGWKGEDGKGDGESVGHAMGTRIVATLRTKTADLTDEDAADMAKVVGYVKRHMAQGPEKDAKTSKWRYSLMKWGHDPCA